MKPGVPHLDSEREMNSSTAKTGLCHTHKLSQKHLSTETSKKDSKQNILVSEPESTIKDMLSMKPGVS